MPSDKLFHRVAAVGTVLFVALFAYCIVATAHWKIVWDQSVFHYIRFMMSRGLKPYSDITDMNLPGCYLAEMGAMAVFGWSDASWRVYEFFLFAALAGSGMVVGGRRAWFAGIMAATVFVLVVLSQGEGFALERDEVMAVLSVAALGCFFTAVRRKQPLWMLPFALLSAFAASLKPSGFFLQLSLLALLLLILRRERTSVWTWLGWTALGDALIGGLLAGFFAATHSLSGFIFIVTKVWPLYAQVGAGSFLQMTLTQVPRALVSLLLVGLAAAYLNRKEAWWERSALLLGTATGALLYYTQLRPAAYHRATFVAFLALWIGFELCLALRPATVPAFDSKPSRLPRFVGLAGVLILFLGIVPYYLRIIQAGLRDPSIDSYFAHSLQADLRTLGGPALQNQVECLDMVDGCLRALYGERLLQNTGTTGDMLLFAPNDSPAEEYYRRWYTVRQQAHPAQVVVISNSWYQSAQRSFGKLAAWPAYAQVVANDYVLVAERFPTGHLNAQGYRIYVRKGSPALRLAQAEDGWATGVNGVSALSSTGGSP